MCDREDPRDHIVVDPAIRGLEAFLDERREVLGAIIPSSTFFALRQKGSLASLKIFSIMVRLLPR